MVKGLPDATRVLFDDARAVANAGVLLPAVLAGRLGIEALVDETVDLGDRDGAANPGRKVMSLVSAMALGADCIDDCDVLRSGQTRAVLGHAVAAPSTLGTFLRAFTFGHVRQLDRVLAETLSRAWAAGAGPGDERLVVDVDSFVGEVYGYDKQGAGYGYTHKRGYHPILATRAGTGEVLHIRARKGSANTSRGALRFVEELIARVDRAGATGPKLLRADSGFWNLKIMARLQTAGWSYSIGVRQQKHIKAAIAAIPEPDWQTLEDYPDGGEAQIAQTMLGRQRLIVRRTRLVGAQAELWPDWRHHAFLTNRTDPLEQVEAEHRQHAVVELAIRDLKDQALAHFPSGKFLANAAWTVIAGLAHNLLRWTTLIGLPDTVIPTARTLRRRLLNVPGRMTRTARQLTLRMPARWPWATQFLTALQRLRAVPALT
ncbi:MAG TPA: IS1380 family transposase [Solirubrobacteraceae bacterium]|nr:IS1380 family transposase [Solirubrobacteraceae bacterium]